MDQLKLIDTDRLDADNSTDGAEWLMADFLHHFDGRAMLTRKEVREFLGISPNGLEQWEREREGPRFKHRHTVQ